jgi:hypothetical protein
MLGFLFEQNLKALFRLNLRGKLIDLGKKIQSVAQILTFLIPSVEY